MCQCFSVYTCIFKHDALTTAKPLDPPTPGLTDLEARLSPPLFRHFEQRERLRVTVREIHLGDVAERGSPSLPAWYLPRLAGDEGGRHCS